MKVELLKRDQLFNVVLIALLIFVGFIYTNWMDKLIFGIFWVVLSGVFIVRAIELMDRPKFNKTTTKRSQYLITAIALVLMIIGLLRYS
ncbi:MAG: hypothetical protein CL904_01660 [Dehalococcoidia bacterium]|nr:hypothetical protein [Dehalococcoidia bacterium]MQG16546.1 hypothetical protein [SAR202 cluster bacterium]